VAFVVAVVYFPAVCLAVLRLIACSLLPVVSLLWFWLLTFLLLLLIFFLIGLIKCFQTYLAYQVRIFRFYFFGFDVATSTGSSSSGKIPCWLSPLISPLFQCLMDIAYCFQVMYTTSGF
jgi:hypothetical protein